MYLGVIVVHVSFVVHRVTVGRGVPHSRPTSGFAANIQSRYPVHSDNCVQRFVIDQRYGLVSLGRRRLQIIQICRVRKASSLVICRLWDFEEALVAHIWQINSERRTPVIIYPYTDHHPKPV
jgi:hypothetical protein